MTQGLRHRPATIRRLGFGLVMLGAAVGCHGTDKLPTSNLSPPPKLPSSLAGPERRSDRARRPGRPLPSGNTSRRPDDRLEPRETPARGGLTPTGGAAGADHRAKPPTTGGNLPLAPADRPDRRPGIATAAAEPTAPTYQPPVVLEDPTAAPAARHVRCRAGRAGQPADRRGRCRQHRPCRRVEPSPPRPRRSLPAADSTGGMTADQARGRNRRDTAAGHARAFVRCNPPDDPGRDVPGLEPGVDVHHRDPGASSC